jgi:hypothetical protein
VYLLNTLSENWKGILREFINSKIKATIIRSLSLR